MLVRTAILVSHVSCGEGLRGDIMVRKTGLFDYLTLITVNYARFLVYSLQSSYPLSHIQNLRFQGRVRSQFRQGGLDMWQVGLDLWQVSLDLWQVGLDLRQVGLDLWQVGFDLQQVGLDLWQNQKKVALSAVLKLTATRNLQIRSLGGLRRTFPKKTS